MINTSMQLLGRINFCIGFLSGMFFTLISILISILIIRKPKQRSKQ